MRISEAKASGLNVAIIEGGISGLDLARLLRGHCDVEVLER